MMVTFSGVKAQDYDWKGVERMVQDRRLSDAYDMLQDYCTRAEKAGDSQNRIRATWELNRVGMMYREDCEDSAIARWLRLEAQMKPLKGSVEEGLCALMKGMFYNEYSGRRYNRNSPTDEPELDYKLWDAGRMRDTVRRCLKQALDCEAMGKTPIRGYEWLVREGNAPWLTPTLWDVVARYAMGLNLEGLPDIEELIKVHRDGEPRLRLHLEIERLERLIGRTPVACDTFVAEIARLYNVYNGEKDCEEVSSLCALAAQQLYQKDRLEEALEWCDRGGAARHEEAGNRGYAECCNLKATILQRELGVEVMNYVESGKADWIKVRSRNMEQGWMRIIPWIETENTYGDRRKRLLLKQPALKQWQVSLPGCGDHRWHDTLAVLSEMPQGDYILLMCDSPDFGMNHNVSAVEYRCSDAAFIMETGLAQGRLVWRGSGQPLKGHKVRMEKSKRSTGKVAQQWECVTDGEGRFSFEIAEELRSWEWKYEISTVVNGYRYSEDGGSGITNSSSSEEEKASIFTNKPIYRPGERVEWSCVWYRGKDTSWHTVQADIKARLLDVNWNEIDTIGVKTNGFGSCWGSFELPATGLNGWYRIELYDKATRNCYRTEIKVESYRQPKFMVSLNQNSDVPVLGGKVETTGMAAAYNGMKISGAEVVWSVTREEIIPWWKRGWVLNHPAVSESEVIASGETRSDADGAFGFEWTALVPEEDMKEYSRYYVYEIAVKVTDLNGETHEAGRSIRIGKENSIPTVASLTETEVKVGLTDLNHEPIAGVVRMEILKAPMSNQPELKHPLRKYDEESLWKGAKVVRSQEVICDGKGIVTVSLEPLASGRYRVVLRSADSGAESEEDFLIVRKGERQPQTDDLVWVEVPKKQEVGETATLRLGSRYKDVWVYYIISQGNRELSHGHIVLNNEIKTLEIPIEESHRGGVGIYFAAIYQNHPSGQSYTIDVPYTNRKLNLHLETFRDKLEPGSRERWTLSVKSQSPQKGVSGKPEMSQITLTMYDAALLNYRNLNWTLNPWPVWRWGIALNQNIHTVSADHYLIYDDHIYGGEWLEASSLKQMLEYGVYAVGGRRMMTKGVAANMAINRAEQEDDVLEKEVFMVAEDAMTDSKQMASVVIAEEKNDGLSVREEGTQGAGKNEKLRQNLNTAAFFIPDLRSDENGEATFEFVAPDLLTQWDVRGIAWTQDLKSGTLQETVITQKELMVVPNVPRFLRHGDRVSMMVKVGNMSDEEQSVAVCLEMSDASTGKAFTDLPSQRITISAGGSEAVAFEFDVPDNIFVATYRVSARGEHHSDGEMGAVVVLPNRQMVTESMSMYLNGSGEKHYQMSHSGGTPYGLTVEYTSNPLWYAVQCLPYLEELQSPSNIYLANRIYVNATGLQITCDYPEIEKMFALWGEDSAAMESPLEKNENLKESLLRETPWVRTAKAEREQHYAVAQYFNKTQREKELKELVKKLASGQASDGSWGWMPGGRSCSYTTQYIARLMGELRKNGVELPKEVVGCVKKAIKFVDSEEQKYYERYIKNKSNTFNATDIDYLYMRSLWGDVPFAGKSKEAYDYYYKNALKDYNVYDNLYTRAQLALIFYRHGDRTTAQKIASGLRQSALYSDEMGMYWRDNIRGMWWYQRPIETQSMLISVMDEVSEDPVSVGKMQQWLLKQKQTTHWGNDVATTMAVNALLHRGKQSLMDSEVAVYVGGNRIETTAQSGTGYVRKQWLGEEITPEMGSVTLRAEHKEGISWGAMYYQYFEDLDKIPYSETGIKLQKDLFRENPDGTLTKTTTFKVGDKVRVRILIDCDRTLEFLELKDGRASAFEPVSTASGWNWNGGLSYYADIHDASSSFFIQRLERGKYVLEYGLYVNAAGDYSNGICTMQCMYAPEFRAHTAGFRVSVSDK